jgi:hypothetical protein
MINSKGFATILAIIIAIVVVGGLAYVAVTRKASTLAISPVTTPLPSPPLQVALPSTPTVPQPQPSPILPWTLFPILMPNPLSIPADWKTYQGEEIMFQYPPTWNVEKIYYATPAQEAEGIPPSVSAHRIFPGTKATGKDFIDIGGHQVSCESPEVYTKCFAVLSISNFVFTSSHNLEVLRVLDILVQTIKYSAF